MDLTNQPQIVPSRGAGDTKKVQIQTNFLPASISHFSNPGDTDIVLIVLSDSQGKKPQENKTNPTKAKHPAFWEGSAISILFFAFLL